MSAVACYEWTVVLAVELDEGVREEDLSDAAPLKVVDWSPAARVVARSWDQAIATAMQVVRERFPSICSDGVAVDLVRLERGPVVFLPEGWIAT